MHHNRLHGTWIAIAILTMSVLGMLVLRNRSEPKLAFPVPNAEPDSRIPSIIPGSGDMDSSLPAYIKTHRIAVTVAGSGRELIYNDDTWELVAGSPISMIDRSSWPSSLDVTEYPDEIRVGTSFFRRRRSPAQ